MAWKISWIASPEISTTFLYVMGLLNTTLIMLPILQYLAAPCADSE